MTYLKYDFIARLNCEYSNCYYIFCVYDIYKKIRGLIKIYKVNMVYLN
jgi:hypothetical protein